MNDGNDLDLGLGFSCASWLPGKDKRVLRTRVSQVSTQGRIKAGMSLGGAGPGS